METPNTYFDLFLGYSVFWLLIFGFLLSLVSRQSKLQKRLGDLEARFPSSKEGRMCSDA